MTTDINCKRLLNNSISPPFKLLIEACWLYWCYPLINDWIGNFHRGTMNNIYRLISSLPLFVFWLCTVSENKYSLICSTFTGTFHLISFFSFFMSFYGVRLLACIAELFTRFVVNLELIASLYIDVIHCPPMKVADSVIDQWVTPIQPACLDQ